MSGNGIVAAVAVAAGSTALRVGYDKKVSDKPAAMFKIVTGAFILGAALSLIGGAAPGLANVLALSIAIAALMLNGAAVVTATGRVFGK